MQVNIPFEIKRLEGNSIAGHGSVFGNVDLGGDIVLPGAFKRSLAQHRKAGTMPAMLWQHDTKQVPGAWREATEDDIGLALHGEFADTQLGRDARTLTKMGAVRGLSIGFQLVDFDFDDDGNRLIKEAALWETSIVTFPMNAAAQVEAVKSLRPRNVEVYLRDAGASRSEAKRYVSELFDQPLRDAEPDALVKLREASEQYRVSREITRLFNNG